MLCFAAFSRRIPGPSKSCLLQGCGKDEGSDRSKGPGDLRQAGSSLLPLTWLQTSFPGSLQVNPARGALLLWGCRQLQRPGGYFLRLCQVFLELMRTVLETVPLGYFQLPQVRPRALGEGGPKNRKPNLVGFPKSSSVMKMRPLLPAMPTLAPQPLFLLPGRDSLLLPSELWPPAFPRPVSAHASPRKPPQGV